MLNFLTCISTTFRKQAVKALARPCVCAWVDQEGTGVQTPPPPLKNHNTIGFPSNTGPDPQKITRLPSQHSMLGHHMYDRRFVGGPMLVRLWWYLDRLSPHQLKNPVGKTFWICARCANSPEPSQIYDVRTLSIL